LSLRTPEKVGKLQATLHAKAKESPELRFYSLYDKVYRSDVLEYAYRRCKANGGAPGVDAQTFSDVEAYGLHRWLGEVAEEMRGKTYRPQAVRRVWIPKPNGKRRPLGIPTICDRVVQMAAVIVLEPIFEADLEPEQYAYREGRNAQEAVKEVHGFLSRGHKEVVDADLSGYFDSIPHAQLMKSVARRVSDGQLLRLIKMWLEMPVEEDDDEGNRHRTTRAKDEGKGTPQGAPISPLLANIYMRRFIVAWKVLGYEERLDAHIVNYADDFVICCKGTAEKAARIMRQIMEMLKLTVNEEKTSIRNLPEESVEFLGYTIGRCFSPRSGRCYIGTRPSRKSVGRIMDAISEITDPKHLTETEQNIVKRLNRLLVGWSNYFCLGPVSKAYRAVNAHVSKRLRYWLRRKHRKGAGATRAWPDEYLYEQACLVDLRAKTRSFSWAKGVKT